MRFGILTSRDGGLGLRVWGFGYGPRVSNPSLSVCVCVCVCVCVSECVCVRFFFVCVREREREGESARWVERDRARRTHCLARLPHASCVWGFVLWGLDFEFEFLCVWVSGFDFGLKVWSV